jgi:hypothetical protein
MLSLVRPRYFVPIHGEYRQLARHARGGEVSAVHQVCCWPRTATCSGSTGGPDRGRPGGPRPDRRHAHGRGRRRGAARPAAPGRRRPGRAGAGDQPQTGALEGVPDVITRGFVRGRATRLAQGDTPACSPPPWRRPASRNGPTRADQGEDPRGAAAGLPQAFGPAAARAAGGDGDLMATPPVRFPTVSEFIGVALFAAALLWLIALASYSADDPVWFFNTGADGPPGELRRARRRVHRRAVVPGARLRGVPGPARAGRRRLALLLVPHAGCGLHQGCRRGAALRCVAAFLGARLGTVDGRTARPFRAGGYLGEWSPGACPVPQPHRLDHPDPHAAAPGDHPLDAVLVRPVLGGGRRAAGALGRRGGVRELAEERRARSSGARSSRSTSRRRKGRRPEPPAGPRLGAAAGTRRRAVKPRAGAPSPSRRPRQASRTAADGRRRRRRRPRARVGRRRRRRIRRPPPPDLPCRCRWPQKAPAERRKGDYTLPPLALLDAPKGRAEDRRARADGRRALLEEKCREFSVEGSVVQIHPGPGRHDLRVQAGRRREVQQDHGLADDLCSRCRPSRC